MEAGPQVSNRFEEREITRLEWTTDIEASQIIQLIFTQPMAIGIRTEQNLFLQQRIQPSR
jgi:hypothetical protein